jgi:hypothetical protein
VLFPAGLCRANASEKGPESPIQGTREIDPTDPDMAEGYGFVQEPIEAEIIEERPEP